MATVNIRPMPASWRDTPARLQPTAPPVFPDGPPSEQDIRLARALIAELDAPSRAWYARSNPARFGDLA